MLVWLINSVNLKKTSNLTGINNMSDNKIQNGPLPNLEFLVWSLKEINCADRNLKNEKSCCPDFVTNEIIKHTVAIQW